MVDVHDAEKVGLSKDAGRYEKEQPTGPCPEREMGTVKIRLTPRR